jgi:group II intron reverse transcriptase/maturase
VEVDIRKFFDTLDRACLREFLQRRVRDGVLLRLIGKWLNAGVLDGVEYSVPEAGTPQGGVISPLLANIYLHTVLDEWFEQMVKPCLKGQSFLIRYADDFVMGFSCEEDARRVLEVLPKRFGKYGLTLHPGKTRLVRFERPPHRPPSAGPKPEPPETFEFLGFRHVWTRSRKGNWVVGRKTASSRFSRVVRKIAQWCRYHRHDPIGEQHEHLSQQLRGHDGYYGITGNAPMLQRLRYVVHRLWRKWLARRRAGPLTWDTFHRLLARLPLPPARVVHSFAFAKANP